MIYEQNHYLNSNHCLCHGISIFAELDNNKQSIEKSCFAIALNAIVEIYIHYSSNSYN